MIEKLGGRKSIMAAVILAVGAGIDMYSKAGLSANMLQLLSVVFGAFCIGNGVEHVAGAMKKPEAADKVNGSDASFTSPDLVGALATMDANAQETKQDLEMTKRAAAATLDGVNFLVDYIKKVQSGN
jgi:hypothetical protein